MQDDIRTHYLQQFMGNAPLVEAVRVTLEEQLLTASKDRDVQNLAARFMAIELLHNAWHELDAYKPENISVDKKVANVGL